MMGVPSEQKKWTRQKKSRRTEYYLLAVIIEKVRYQATSQFVSLRYSYTSPTIPLIMPIAGIVGFPATSHMNYPDLLTHGLLPFVP